MLSIVFIFLNVPDRMALRLSKPNKTYISFSISFFKQYQYIFWSSLSLYHLAMLTARFVRKALVIATLLS